MGIIKNLNSLFKAASLVSHNDFAWGVDLLKNKGGEDNYPLLYTELPLNIVFIENKDGKGITNEYTVSAVLYSVVQRVDKTDNEELDSLDLALEKAIQFVNQLREVSSVGNTFYVDVAGVGYLTYSGVDLADFSDDVDGVRIDLTLRVISVDC